MTQRNYASMGLFLAAAIAAASGCSKDGQAAAPGAAAGSAGQPAHCDSIQSTSTCREYRPIAVEAAGEDSLRQLCSVGGSFVFGRGPCPPAGLVGTCDKPEHIERYYSRGSSAFTAASAQQACASGFTAGTFRAGP